MLVNVESTSGLERKMRVELPAARIDEEVESRLRRVGRTAKIKGFRPGKIPPKVVKQHYGQQVRQEVLSDLMQKSYSDAVQQENLSPAGGPSIEPVPTDNKADFAYVATFEVLPDVTLNGLDKLKVTRPDVQIGDGDVDDMLENLRRQKADWTEVERKSKTEDRVTVDFDGTLKGEPITGGQGTEVPVVLGQGQMLPDFEKGLTSVAAGDETTFKVKFPKDYPAEELQGKTVEFAVKVHRVEELELPPLDDSLAELYNIEGGSLDKFKEEVIANMEREARQKVRTDVKEQVMQGLIDLNPIDVPQALVQQEAQNMQHEAMRRLGLQDPAQAPALDNFLEAAEKRVRLGLLLRQYIQDESIAVDADRLRGHVEEMCAGYEQADEMVANYLSNPQLVSQIEPVVLEDQALDRLIEQGKEKSKKVDFKEYMNPPQ
ncbi:MAG: trigger factor [Pseudomonadota bacterium]